MFLEPRKPNKTLGPNATWRTMRASRLQASIPSARARVEMLRCGLVYRQVSRKMESSAVAPGTRSSTPEPRKQAGGAPGGGSSCCRGCCSPYAEPEAGLPLHPVPGSQPDGGPSQEPLVGPPQEDPHSARAALELTSLSVRRKALPRSPWNFFTSHWPERHHVCISKLITSWEMSVPGSAEESPCDPLT